MVTSVTVTGAGFGPSSTITIEFDGNPVTTSPTTVISTALDSSLLPSTYQRPPMEIAPTTCDPESPTLCIGKDGGIGSRGPKVTELQAGFNSTWIWKSIGNSGYWTQYRKCSQEI